MKVIYGFLTFKKVEIIEKADARAYNFDFKVLLRRNFDVMFITKNHFYQFINEDCHLKLD